MGFKDQGSGSGSKAALKSVAEGVAAAPGLDKMIKSQIERAQSVFRRGNHKKALKIMKELCRRHQSSALAHNVRGSMHFDIAALIDDPNIKQRHLKHAVESARRARLLSPKSVEYAHFYAHLLFELGDDKESYQEVMCECQRTLKFLRDGDQSDQLMPQSRMAELRQELEALMKKAAINTSSTVMMQLGLGNWKEKFKFDSKEEKKKLRTSTEGRRMEIEAQMEAAKVSQKTLKSLPLEEEEEELSSRALRLERRKKSANIKKMVSLGDRINQVEKYWNSLSSDTRRGLLQVRISDLRAYFSSPKDDLAAAVLSEAIAFAEKNKTWKFMACCVCDEKFTDLSPYVEHFMEEHVGKLSPRMLKVMPQEIDSDWVEIIEKGRWKPVDALAVFQISEDQVKSRSSSVVERDTMIDMDDFLEICIEDPWESYSMKGKKKQFDEEFMEVEISNQNGEGGNHEPKESDRPGPGWPLSDDPQRARTLEGIQVMFRMLLRQGHLATRHIVQVMQYTMDELQIFVSASQLINHGLDHTPLCICFLGVSQLEKVLRFLQSLACICGVTKFSDEGSSTDEVLVAAQGSEIKERIVFSSDLSSLLLDKRLLRGELNLSTYKHAISDDGSAVTSAVDDHEDDVLPDGDSLVPWLFSGCSIEEQLASWAGLREDKKHQGMKMLNILEKEFSSLEGLSQKKSMHSIYEDALQAIEHVCLEESKRRARDPKYLPQYYEYLLEEWQRKVEADGDDKPLSCKFELDLISNILKEVHTMSINLLSCEDSPSDDQEHLEKSDTIVEEAIRRYEVQVTLELCRIDARIMGLVAAMRQQDLKLGAASALDYRSIMVIFIKSFVRARLEDLVDKDAIKKSNAARESLLAQLALDGEKNISRGDYNTKQKQRRSKNRKKNKFYRKAKDLKASSGNEQLLLHEEDAKQARAQDPAYDTQYHENRLKKKKEEREVADVDVDDTTVVRSQLDLLSKLLEEAHDLRKEIQKYEVQITLELCRTDARIARILAAMQQEGRKFGEASARAYRSIIVISLKSFIGSILEDLVDKDAVEKASAAEEALLADLALDGKKSADRGDGKKMQTEKKSKNKKKNKYYKKSEDLEASSSGKQFLPDGKDVEQKELRCQDELEAEERRLETTLESQLKIDDESEKEHLAEKNTLGERIEQHSSDETAIGMISPGSLKKAESSSAAGQKTTSIGKIPIMLSLLNEKLEGGKSVVFSKGSNEADDGDSDNEDSENSDHDDAYGVYQDFAESSEIVPQRIFPKREKFKALQTDACGADLKNDDNNCSLNAIIQDILTKEIIGRGTKKEELYYMEDFSLG